MKFYFSTGFEYFSSLYPQQIHFCQRKLSIKSKIKKAAQKKPLSLQKWNLSQEDVSLLVYRKD